MLKIGDFSKLTRISISMLRHYDKIGLLKPVKIDNFTGYRYYKEEQFVTACRIVALKNMGFSLVEIKEILSYYDNPEKIEKYLSAQEKKIERSIEESLYCLQLLRSSRKYVREGKEYMNYNVILKTIPERYVASVRMIVPSYDAEGMAWEVLNSETKDKNMIADDPCLCSAVFYDDEHKESNVDIEVQKTVKGKYKDTEHVKFKTQPAVLVASTVHNGSYKGIDIAVNAVAQWVCDNGYEVSDNMFNIYHISPHETDNPNEFVTEVCFPIAKKG